MAKKSRKMGGIGQMSTTSKLMLASGAVGVAAYLLWRIWPRGGDATIPVEPATTSREPGGPQGGFGIPERESFSVVEGSCPVGYVWNDSTKQCELYVE